jgi:polysaccharide pyruvyl transferase WcaK-like protein
VLFPKEDTLLAQALQMASQKVHDVRIAHAPRDLLKWIPEYRLIIASRFHALVLAATARVPFVGWGDQKKLESFCRRHHMPYTNTKESWDEKRLLEQVRSSFAGAPS